MEAYLQHSNIIDWQHPEVGQPQEKLAYPIRLSGEWDCKQIFAEPLPLVVKALKTYQNWDELHENLPDMCLNKL